MKMANETGSARPTAVVVASGGLDSTTLAYHLLHGGYQLRLVSFDYGQRHRRELDFAVSLARRLSAPHHLVDLRALGRLLSGSALTDATVEVPDGHYTDELMRVTVVPNRNALLLDVAVAVAISCAAEAVAFGAHGGDHVIYPDCRPAFVEAFDRSVRAANEGFLVDGFQLLAPFLSWTKTEVVRRGAELGVPFADTWSCYKGDETHCGTCGTCTERREAFALAGVADPTRYTNG
jgi:7-cyano-7-deazaguanine synthase